MRSRTGYLRLQRYYPLGAQKEELQPRRIAKRLPRFFMALADSGVEHDPSGEDLWSCEIELLEEYCDVEEQVPNVTIPTKH